MGADRYAKLLGVVIADEPDTLYKRADQRQAEAEAGLARARNFGLISMTLFLAGAIPALFTLIASAPLLKRPEDVPHNPVVTCYFCSVTSK